MLSEIAIDNPKAFAELVAAAKAGLEGKVVKTAEVKTEKPKAVKTTEKKETSKKEDNKDLSKLTVAELKELAKEKGVAVTSTMKKADIIDALK